MALIEMGDFVGAVLKHSKRNPIEKLSIVGGFGKISKMAQGHKDLHSKISSIDFGFLANAAKHLGASADIVERVLAANTSAEVLLICSDLALGDYICEQAWQHASAALPPEITLELWAIDRKGSQVGNFLNTGGTK